MAGSTVAVIVMPIVIAISLVVWLAGVFYANAHPTRSRYNTDIRAEVRGGSFQAVEGGRQLMPIPGHRPTVPTQRGPAAAETYQESGASPTGTGAQEDAAPSEDQVETRPMASRPPELASRRLAASARGRLGIGSLAA